jgi:hypothetical protein
MIKKTYKKCKQQLEINRTGNKKMLDKKNGIQHWWFINRG